MDRISIDNITIVSSYSFKEINCQICKHPLIMICPSLMQLQNLQNLVIIGKCGHIFHNYCINKYVELCGLCPCDLNEWEKQFIIDI